jgi:16S rRNA (cytosine1402-N4)-methyltransferase
VHIPVMRDEVVTLLRPERGGLFVDCTVGLGGHARALLQHGATRLVGLDRDPAALALARETLADWKDRVDLVHADYRDLGSVLDARGVGVVDGVVADLGVSSMQLESEGRGFSFRRDEPLDMRMDTTRGETAADLLAGVEETELANVIFQFGEERHSRRIARALIAARGRAPLTSTVQVADIVHRALARKGWQRIDPATRTFQALRIWVNRELEGLDAFLVSAARRLAVGARLAVISFHSLEDRIVKQTFRQVATTAAKDFHIVTRRPLTATQHELATNARARSAKLRVLERIAAVNGNHRASNDAAWTRSPGAGR